MGNSETNPQDADDNTDDIQLNHRVGMTEVGKFVYGCNPSRLFVVYNIVDQESVIITVGMKCICKDM